MLSAASPAAAKDYKEALAQKEARKALLKKAATKSKTAGGEDSPKVFKTPDFSGSEGAAAPN